jgi:hypothetical protein
MDYHIMHFLNWQSRQRLTKLDIDFDYKFVTFETDGLGATGGGGFIDGGEETILL